MVLVNPPNTTAEWYQVVRCSVPVSQLRNASESVQNNVRRDWVRPLNPNFQRNQYLELLPCIISKLFLQDYGEFVLIRLLVMISFGKESVVLIILN